MKNTLCYTLTPKHLQSPFADTSRKLESPFLKHGPRAFPLEDVPYVSPLMQIAHGNYTKKDLPWWARLSIWLRDNFFQRSEKKLPKLLT